MNKKLPNKKYLRIHDQQFKEWVVEIMSDEKFKYASKQDVANEIEKRHGGVAQSHMFKIRNLRLNVEDYIPERGGEE
jgi:hypothetical protein